MRLVMRGLAPLVLLVPLVVWLAPLVLLVPLVLLCAGCSADLDALFADEEALVALLPARPDESVAVACGMCAVGQCEKRRAACEKDDSCSRLLACKGPCSDPACLFACEAEHAARGEHNNFHTCLYDEKCPGDPDCVSECKAEHRAAETYDAYRACVFEDKCSDECATGKNWQCLGEFSWTPPDGGRASSPRLTIMVKDINRLDQVLPGAAGVSVCPCASPESCVRYAQAHSNSYGVATLESLPLDDDNAFDGYLRFRLDELDDNGIRQNRDIGRPIHDELTMEELVMPKYGETGRLNEIERFMRDTPEEGAAHIAARVFDCLNAPAPEISFSLPSDRVSLPSYRVALPFYNLTSEHGGPGTKTNETGMGGFGNLRDIVGTGSALIRAVRSGDGALISEREIEIETDTLTRVDLYPQGDTDTDKDADTDAGADAGTDGGTDAGTDADTGAEICQEPADDPGSWSDISDNFDTYTVGASLAEQAGDPWVVWDYNSGGPLDPVISDVQAFSGAKSILVETYDDLVLDLGTLAEGAYQIDFQIYVPAGNIAYFNILQRFWSEEESSGIQEDHNFWGVDVWFDHGGTGVVLGEGPYRTFDYAQDAWVAVSAVIDLDANQATMSIGGEEVHTWAWRNLDYGGASNCQRLAGVDFHGSPTDSIGDLGRARYYIDDVSVARL